MKTKLGVEPPDFTFGINREEIFVKVKKEWMPLMTPEMLAEMFVMVKKMHRRVYGEMANKEITVSKYTSRR